MKISQMKTKENLLTARRKERKSKKVKAEVIDDTKKTAQYNFIGENVEERSKVYTDDFKSYRKLEGYEHEFVRHSVGEYVEEMAHINGLESFWSMLNAHTKARSIK